MQHPPLTCAMCRRVVAKRSGRQEYCDDCRPAFRRQYHKQWVADHPHTKIVNLEWQRQNAERLQSQARANYVPKPVFDKVCPECGASFAGTVRRRFCSVPCQQRFSIRNASHVRRLRLRQAERESFGLFEIAERDAWVCHICNDRVTPLTWSIDHLVPLAAGGAHRADNVAIAHRSCNSRRSTAGYVRIAPDPSLPAGRFIPRSVTCVECGAVFGMRGRAIYCGQSCYRAAARRRRSVGAA